MTIDLIARMRAVLAQSRVWQHHTTQLDVLAIGRAGPIDMGWWTEADHATVRTWATTAGPHEQLPPKVREYFDAVRAVGPN